MPENGSVHSLSLHNYGHMDFHKFQTVARKTDMACKMKDEPDTSNLLCVQHLKLYKKIPQHPSLALELHESSLAQRFDQTYPTVKNNVIMTH